MTDLLRLRWILIPDVLYSCKKLCSTLMTSQRHRKGQSAHNAVQGSQQNGPSCQAQFMCSFRELFLLERRGSQAISR
jgi:hypothetical protein